MILATVAMFAAVLALSRAATSPRMSLLYSGLDAAAAGDVIEAIDQSGVDYEVRGSAIYVDSRHRDSLRMTLAGEGLPANGAAGYELLDSLSGFGTTSQMFDAAYWRAKEGELARTILSNPQFRSARVHIAAPSSRPFARSVKPSAAVTVSVGGGAVAPAQAQALRHLVAASVAGLLAEDVSVIDATTGMVVADEMGAGYGRSADERSEALKARLERILAARVGPGRSVVEVSVETETQTESIRERRFDPETRVAISSEQQEKSVSSKETGSNGVTVASNLPEGDAGNERSAERKETESRNRVNYEVSETEREILRSPGAIKRLSVAVLVDGTMATDANGTETWQPLPDEELESLRELVASAAGYDEARGDVITIKSMQFEPVDLPGTGPQGGLFKDVTLDPLTLIQLGVLGTVALILGLFVVRPILAGPPGAVTASLPAPDGGSGDTALLSGEVDPDDGMAGGFPMGQMGMAEIDPADFGGGMGIGAMGEGSFGGGDDSAVDRLKDLIESRREESVAILRGWMEEPQENA
ncbi:Flagellar M-ring protein FliF [Rhodovulum sp. P5]|nr:Flagellar M-ring protein FliF [Rhodovulum sp. P5]